MDFFENVKWMRPFLDEYEHGIQFEKSLLIFLQKSFLKSHSEQHFFLFQVKFFIV